jgi:hypothetical protein
MNLYLIERKGETGWDEYDGFVVAARTQKEAREVACERARRDTDFLRESGSSCILLARKMLKGGREPRVVLGSFNAA